MNIYAKCSNRGSYRFCFLGGNNNMPEKEMTSRQIKADRTKARIYECAMQLFREKRYESVKISLLTPKFTLVPDQFFDATSIKEELGEVTKLNPDDNVEFVRIPEYGAVLVFSNTLGETLSRTIAQTVFTSDGYQARILPEMYHMIYALEECTEYNKILASYADGYLYLLIAQGKSLLLANAFRAPDFTTAEYFIFLSMRKLQLNPEVSSICFRTPVSQEEEMSLYRYFKAVEHI